MKRTIKTVLLIIGVSGFSLLLVSLKKDKPRPTYNVTILGQSITLDNNLSVEEIDTLYERAYAINKYERSCVLGLSYSDINEIFQYLDTNYISINISGAPYIIAFYCRKDNTNNEVTSSNLKAISFWMYNGTNLNHYYFLNNGGSLTEDSLLRKQSDFFSFTLNDILHFYSFKSGYDPDSSISYIYRGNLSAGARSYTGVKDGGISQWILEDQVFNYAHRVIGMADSTIQKYWDDFLYSGTKYPNRKGCEKEECGKEDGECRDMTPEDNNPTLSCYTREDHTCRMAQVANKAKEVGSFSLSNFNFDLLYSFRDKFLTKFSRGRSYIRFYYILSYFSQNTAVSSSSVSDYISAFTTLYPKFTKTMSSGDCNEILITTAMKNAILAYLNTYRGYNTNTVYRNIIDTIEADVLNLYNKPKYQIFDELGIPSPCGGSIMNNTSVIPETEQIKSISIYPNPIGQSLRINCSNSDLIGREAMIELYDIAGKLLFKKAVILNQSIVVDISSARLSAGIKVIKVSSGNNQSLVSKVIKL